MISENNTRIAIIGLGYVGFPLAVEFGKFYKTIGYDINKDRIKELLGGFDSTKEVDSDDIKKSTKLSYVSDIKAFGKKDHILYDVKYLFNSKDVDGRL